MMMKLSNRTKKLATITNSAKCVFQAPLTQKVTEKKSNN